MACLEGRPVGLKNAPRFSAAEMARRSHDQFIAQSIEIERLRRENAFLAGRVDQLEAREARWLIALKDCADRK